MYDCINGKAIMKKEQQEKEYQISAIVSGADLENIIIAALDSGVSHWAKLDCVRQSIWNDKPSWLSESRYATQILIEGGKILLIDIRDPIVYYELTLRKLINGINDYINSTTLKVGSANFDVGRLPAHVDSEVANEIIINAIFGRR